MAASGSATVLSWFLTALVMTSIGEATDFSASTSSWPGQASAASMLRYHAPGFSSQYWTCLSTAKIADATTPPARPPTLRNLSVPATSSRSTSRSTDH